jgi:hypothetical protein
MDIHNDPEDLECLDAIKLRKRRCRTNNIANLKVMHQNPLAIPKP